MTAKKCAKKAGSTYRVVVFCLSNLLLFFDVLVAIVSLSLIKPRGNGRNVVGCYMLRLMLGIVAPFAHHCNTDATTRNIVGATMLGVVVSVCT